MPRSFLVKLDRILIASDHAGIELKVLLQKKLPEWSWEDLGPTIPESVDYPDFAAKLAQTVAQNPSTLGILICGSGIGMCIAANKVNGIRAAAVESVETARLSREHNNANILCLGARLLPTDKALEIVRTWLETPFSNESRHNHRLAKISALEKRRT